MKEVLANAARYAMPPFLTESFEVYQSHRRECVTSHQLADFHACPLKHKQQMAGLIPETIGDFYNVGAALHCLTLEGRERFDAEYHVGGPINPKTGNCYGKDTKKYAEWAAEQTKRVISDEDYPLVCQMDHSVRTHAEAPRLLSDGVSEGVLRGKYCGLDCQIRVDRFSPTNGLLDLKSCYNLDKFADDLVTYEYPHQMAFYRAIIAQHIGQLVPVHLIAVEKQPPYRCGVWYLTNRTLAKAARENEERLYDLADCRMNDHWPTRYEEVRAI